MPPVPLRELPQSIDLNDLVAQCYGEHLDAILDAVHAHQSVLVECDKTLVVNLLIALRERNRARSSPITMEIVDHREGDAGATMNTARALNEQVRAFSQKVAETDGGSRAVVVPNFDILASSDQTTSHLDVLTRDMLAVLNENPDLILVAFKDPHLNLPNAVLSFFPKRIEIFGIERRFMPQIITQVEARRIDTQQFDPYSLYKYVSGLNAVKLRKVLQGFASERYADGGGESILNEIRKATVQDAQAELPRMPMDRIGGYDEVKQLLREEVLGLLEFIQKKSSTAEREELHAYERLIPRNILFTGPPGTGKTLFCKALATELNATIFVVNGPELKSKWVGESERAIRNIFARARKCAPSLIVFDEIDSFAKKRHGGDAGLSSGAPGTATASDSSMLNQFLTEMDGFRAEEMVFVIGTTNIASALDTALLSRFKHRIEIPYPDLDDRRAIMQVYDRMYDLHLSATVMDTILRETEQWIDQNNWTRFAGRDLEAVASALARGRVIQSYRENKPLQDIPVTPDQAAAVVREKIRTKPWDMTFADIGGYREVKARLQDEILSVLKAARGMSRPERLATEKLIPKGIIFEGPPGTGKTMFAKALANELDATVSVVNGPELKTGLVGETEAHIRRLFEEARKNAPSVIVFDELDSIASARELSAGGSERATVNQLLTEMDGIGQRGLVFVVATTNFAKLLDRALKRPGRFEYVINIPYPDQEARREILSIYNGKYRLGLGGEAIEHLLFRTDNWVDPEAGIRFSGDHIEAICRGIARRKLMDRSWKPTTDNLDRVVAQRTKKPLELSPAELAVVATHEAGHATVSMNIEGARPIKRISIASEYDGSLGYVLHEDMPNKFVQNRDELCAEICVLLAGRIAEKKLLGKVATGGANDLEKATLIATHLAATLGMDEEIGSRMVLHPMVHGRKAADSTSPELLRKVETAVDRILHEQEERAATCLDEKWDEYNALREQLMDRKVVELR